MIGFTVYGRPQPQGSARAFIPKGWKRPVITTANKNLKSWRQEVALVAQEIMAVPGNTIISRPRPVTLHVVFCFARPKSLGKGIMENTRRPDIEKCCRALADALTGICYDDDSQITCLRAEKLYGSPERTEVRLSA